MPPSQELGPGDSQLIYAHTQNAAVHNFTIFVTFLCTHTHTLSFSRRKTINGKPTHTLKNTSAHKSIMGDFHAVSWADATAENSLWCKYMSAGWRSLRWTWTWTAFLG